MRERPSRPGKSSQLKTRRTTAVDRASRLVPRQSPPPSRSWRSAPPPAGSTPAGRCWTRCPPDAGLAFILVQHLDPTHDSMLVELLAGHTSMKVCQATDGMPIEREHLYVIPPGAYLSVQGRRLAAVAAAGAPRRAAAVRFPAAFAGRGICPTAPSASCFRAPAPTAASGLKAVKEKGGLVIAQDPEEAGYDGMPRSAILTGAVDLVLPAAKIPAGDSRISSRARDGARLGARAQDWLAAIIELLRTKTAHDFRTLQAGHACSAGSSGGWRSKPTTMDAYLQMLRDDPKELDLSGQGSADQRHQFLPRPESRSTFSPTNVIPGLVARSAGGPAACGSGSPDAAPARKPIPSPCCSARRSPPPARTSSLQVFASDIDADAVAQAREGLYPPSIEADVSPERLARFFVKEDAATGSSPDLRADVVFTVQDVLADPPFSRLDFVSCRNLLIYLARRRRRRSSAMFHFALREGGVLLLGGAETVGEPHGRFTAISKTERIFRHAARGRPGDFGFLGGDGVRFPRARAQAAIAVAQTRLAELCRRLVLENYAPAAVLINRKNECLFSLGADRSLSVRRAGPADARSAGHGAQGPCAPSSGRRSSGPSRKTRPSPSAAAASSATAGLCPSACRRGRFAATARNWRWSVSSTKRSRERRQGGAVAPGEVSRVAELEQELEATRTELQGAIRDLEICGRGAEGDQRGGPVGQRGIPVDQRGTADLEGGAAIAQRGADGAQQPASGNAGPAAHHLRRSAERALQHRCRDDLSRREPQHPLFHARDPKSLFNVIASDVGRPLADLASLAADSALLSDARAVLAKHLPIEREIETRDGAWYMRRILPYRTQDGGVEGVVITFADITERKERQRRAGGRQTQRGNRRRGEVALSRRRQPRPAPAAANAGAASGAAGARRGRRARSGNWSRGSAKPLAR